LKISAIAASTHRLAVQPPFLRNPVVREMVVTRLVTDSGITGHGIAGWPLAHSVRDFINRELGPFLVGRDVHEFERTGADAYLQFNQRGYSGVVQGGISAVDIALWDVRGKALGQPVWRLLGGYSDRVPAYVTFGLLDYDVDSLVAFAGALVAEGHRSLKMVVAIGGGHRILEDADRVRRVREAIGPNVELAVDANQLFDMYSARALAEMIEPFGIRWFEEPIQANDIRALADLRRHTSIPIAAGQNEGHIWRHRDLIASGSVDVAQPNVLSVGGYTQAIKVAHLAESYSLPVANGGGWPHHNAHLHAAVPNGHSVEFHYPTWKFGELLFEGAPTIEAGAVALSERPGLGFEPKEDILKDTIVE
jgi:L-alanine-DL-glutamate epimerase-like enolase superfamily enzyme